MSITSVNEHWEGQEGQLDNDGNSFTRTFVVVSDNPEETAYKVCATNVGPDQLPDIGDAYPDSAVDLPCTNIRATRRSDSRLVWDVTATYGIDEDESDSSGYDPDDPTTFPADINFGWRTVTEAFERAYDTVDANGNPIAAVVNRPWKQPLVGASVERSYLVISITKNFSVGSFDAGDLLDYNDTVNNAEITIADITLAARQGHMNISATQERSTSGVKYYAVTYQIDCIFNQGGHEIGFLNTGAHYRGDSSTNGSLWKPYLDKFGERFSEPQKIDSAGLLINDSAAVYVYYLPYPQADWSSLTLPTSV
jgi:hypothetical protein